MFAFALNSFRTAATAQTRPVPEPPARRGTPVFIGDAVQPWGGETLLLEIIRRDADRHRDQP